MLERTLAVAWPLLVVGASTAGCKSSSPDVVRADAGTMANGSVVAPSSPQPQLIASTVARRQIRKWDFETERVDQPPSGFSGGRTGGGNSARWLVLSHDGSNVLGQVDADATSFRFPVAVAVDPELRDVRVSVRCKPITGKTDQACGLVARYRDQNNYYVTRANALEGNVRLYTVKGGRREQIADFSGPIAANSWHELRLEVRGDRLQVAWDGKRVIDERDGTFPNAGRVGVWTKADSVTYFDDLTAEAL